MRFTRRIIRNRAISLFTYAACLFIQGDNGARTRENNSAYERHRARYVRHRREFCNRCYVRERLVGGVAAVLERRVCLFHEKMADSYRGRTTCIVAGRFSSRSLFLPGCEIILSSSQKFYVIRRSLSEYMYMRF